MCKVDGLCGGRTWCCGEIKSFRERKSEKLLVEKD